MKASGPGNCVSNRDGDILVVATRLEPGAANSLISSASRAIGLGVKALVVLTVLGSLAIGSSTLAQSPGGVSQPSYATKTTGVGTTSKSASGGSAEPAGTPDEESKTAEEDDTLYHGRTDEMETGLLRDDGMLHFKTHPKEKTQKVDSLKSLQSSGTDPKFQGQFATSGVNSIDKIAGKPAETGESQKAKLNLSASGQQQTESAPQPAEVPSDTRFVRRHATFSPPPEEKSEKTEADSTPSPTPSPSASPAAKKSGASKE